METTIQQKKMCVVCVCVYCFDRFLQGLNFDRNLEYWKWKLPDMSLYNLRDWNVGNDIIGSMPGVEQQAEMPYLTITPKQQL